MKTLISVLALAAFLGGCSSRTEKKFEKKQMDIQKQEAIEMINKLDGDDKIKIKRSRFGNDKIILDEN